MDTKKIPNIRKMLNTFHIGIQSDSFWICNYQFTTARVMETYLDDTGYNLLMVPRGNVQYSEVGYMDSQGILNFESWYFSWIQWEKNINFRPWLSYPLKLLIHWYLNDQNNQLFALRWRHQYFNFVRIIEIRWKYFKLLKGPMYVKEVSHLSALKDRFCGP
jgi:hypothetical protein